MKPILIYILIFISTLVFGQTYTCLEITDFRKNQDSIVFSQLDTSFYNCTDFDACICLNKQIGSYFRSKGKSNKAILFFNHKLEKLEPSSDKQWRAKGWLYADIAYVYRYHLSDLKKALNYYLKAHDILVNKLQLQEKYIGGSLLSPIGNIYTSLGDFERALIYLEAAEKRYKDLGLGDKRAQMLGNMSIIYFTKGEYHRAIDRIKTGLSMANVKEHNRIFLLVQLAKCHSGLLQHDAALIYADQALNWFQNQNKSTHDQHSFHYKAELLHIKANAHAALGQDNEALALYKEGINLKHSLIPTSESRELAKMYLELAGFYNERDSTNLALQEVDHALSFLLPDSIFSKRDSMLEDFELTPENSLADAFYLKADCLVKQYKKTNLEQSLNEAIACYQLVVNIWDRLRQEYQYETSNLNVLARRKRIISNAMEALATSYQLDRTKDRYNLAFNFSTTSKNLSLLEFLKRNEAIKNDIVPDSTQSELSRLSSDIEDLQQQLYKQRDIRDKSFIDSIRWTIMESKNKIEAIEQELAMKNDEFRNIKLTNPIIKTSIIRQNLNKNQTLIDYFISDSTLTVFKINKEDETMYQIPLYIDVGKCIDSIRTSLYDYFYYSNLSNTHKYEKYKKSYIRLAENLYDMLLSPLGTLTEELIIIPDAVLSNLPFEVLLTQASGHNMNYKDLPYLVKAHSISYNYSTYFLNQQTQEKPLDVQTLMVAPVFENNSIQFADASDYRRNNLGPLKWNTIEIENIQKIVGGKALIGPVASLDTFLNFYPNYSIIHIASHAKLEETNSSFSYIAFTPNMDDDQKFKLYLNKLMNLKHQSEMVVLSACETGLGQINEGDGVASLARGFAHAGSKSIITSLWQVNDKSTSNIMTSFYRNLKNGGTKDSSLRLAKLEYIEDQVESHLAHPFYWAGFVAIGDMSPIEFQSQTVLLTTVFLFLGLSFLFILIYKYYTSKK